MDLTTYRNRKEEQERINDLMNLLPERGKSILDIGARDGYISIRLADVFDSVTALDLSKPEFEHDKVHCLQGDVTCIDFPDNSFDVVICAEVLEHLPQHLLIKACSELVRVAKNHIIVGVPYKQDIRLGRTTCYTCGGKNPPWGHVNTFDESHLKQLFNGVEVEKISFVGTSYGRTNMISAWLMDLAGNPNGTYSQEEPCIHCGQGLKAPPPMNALQIIFAWISLFASKLQKPFNKSHANWIHMLLRKNEKVLTSAER